MSSNPWVIQPVYEIHEDRNLALAALVVGMLGFVKAFSAPGISPQVLALTQPTTPTASPVVISGGPVTLVQLGFSTAWPAMDFAGPGTSTDALPQNVTGWRAPCDMILKDVGVQLNTVVAAVTTINLYLSPAFNGVPGLSLQPIVLTVAIGNKHFEDNINSITLNKGDVLWFNTNVAILTGAVITGRGVPTTP